MPHITPQNRSRQRVAIDIGKAEHRLAEVDPDSAEASALMQRIQELEREYVEASAE